MEKLVVLEQIDKIYKGNTIINAISLEISTGEVVAIRGGNGTGKSTLLRLLAQVEAPSSGRVVYVDKKTSISYVPERFPKQLRFTPSEYLTYIGKIGGIPQAELKQIIQTYLDQFQLTKFDDRWISDLSKGNIQKVGIIQSLLQKPDILILDEPFSGLDLPAQKELWKLMDEFKSEGRTIVLSYHESNALESIVDTTFLLKDGKISKIHTTKKEIKDLKVLQIKNIDSAHVKQWEGIQHIIEQQGVLMLYVEAAHSDYILSEILKLQGNIVSVLAVESDNKTEKVIGRDLF